MRFLINSVLAVVVALSGIAIESGTLSGLAAVAFADNCGQIVVQQSNPAGSNATVCGTFNGTTQTTFRVTVLAANAGQITKVRITDGMGHTADVTVNGSTPFRVLDSGLTMSFSSSSKNTVGDTYSFTAQPKCNPKKTKECDH